MNRTENRDMCYIYQLKEEASGILFLSLERLKSREQVVNRENYEMVYAEEYKGLELDQIYEKFNINHPEGFRGHSLSVSDIVVLRRNGVDWAYFLDDFGFADVSLEFLADLDEFAVQVENRVFIIQKRRDGGWDYSILDQEFNLLDGGVLENAELSLREALNEIIQDSMNDDFLKGEMNGDTEIERVDFEWAMEQMEQSEKAKIHAQRACIKTPENICECLKQRGYNAKVEYVVRNGVTKVAVIIRDEGSVVSPVIYLENLRCSAKPLGKVADEIISIHKNNKDVKIDIEAIWKKENVLSNVRIGLQRAGNEPLVKKNGFPVEEMEAYLYLTGNLGNGDSYSIKIFQDRFERIQEIEIEELWEKAEINTFGEVWMCPMGEMLRAYGENIEDSPVEIYVLTNEEKNRGASQILNERYLRAFVSQKWGGWKSDCYSIKYS